jgi:hypothetical protein
MGDGVLGVLDALARVTRGPASEPDWYAAFGIVFGSTALWTVGLLSLLPLALRARRGGGLVLGLALGQAALFTVLLFRNPVPALWVFLLPNLIGRGRRSWVAFVAAAPLLALLGLGVVAWSRGFVHGVWLAPWEIAAAAFALACAFAAPGGGRPARASRHGGKRRGGKKTRRGRDQ